MDDKLKIAYKLSWSILLLYTIIIPLSYYTIHINEIGAVYGINVRETYLTFSIFILSLIFSMIGSFRARLIWLGILCFFIYKYISMPFAIYYLASKNWSIIYFVSFLIVLPAFISGLKSIDINKLASKFSKKTPRKISAIFILLVTLIIIVSEIIHIYPFCIDLEFHRTRYLVELLPKIILNLVVLTPLYIFIAVALFKRKTIGYIFSPILLVMNTFLWMNGIGKTFNLLYYFTMKEFLSPIITLEGFTPSMTISLTSALLAVIFIFFLKRESNYKKILSKKGIRDEKV